MWVFTRTGGFWVQQGSEVAGSGVTGGDALQGTSLALTSDGNTAYMGGPTDNAGIGAVWQFARPASQFPPSIATQPASQSITTGQTATLSVTAAGPGPFTYQWYLGSKGNTSTPVGSNSSSFTTPALTATTSYWVRLTTPFGTVDSETATVSVISNAPVITRVSNAANGSAAIAPNTWVAIQGSNLAPAGDTRSWQASDFVNAQMPTKLDGVSVTVNGRPAYVSYISPTQINILTPPDALQANAPVQVLNGPLISTLSVVPSQPLTPTFFVDAGGPYVAATHADGTYLGPATLFPG